MRKVLGALIMFFVWLPIESAYADLDMPIPSDTIRVDASSTMAKIVRLETIPVLNYSLVSTRNPETSFVTTLPCDNKTARGYHLDEWIPFVRDSSDVLIRDGYANLMKAKDDPNGIVAQSVKVEVTLRREPEQNFISLYVRDKKTGRGVFVVTKSESENTLLIVVRSMGLVQGPKNLNLIKLIVAESFNVVATKSDEEKLVHLAESLVAEMTKVARSYKPTPVGNDWHNTNHLGAQSSRRP